MYNLYFLSDKAKLKIKKHWRITSTKTGDSFEGDLPSVINYAKIFYDITEKELQIALDQMIKTKKDVGHFGYMGRFIHTFDSFEEDTEKGINNGFH